MPILLDHQLQGHIQHDILAFPVAFYCDELAALPNRAEPMHWHPCFEIATAQSSVLDCQVGQIHTILEPGDSAASAVYWKQSSAILIPCQNPKHHGYI